MRYALLFPLIALGLCLVTRKHEGWTWILLWPAFSFLVVGLAYAFKTPRVFGKRAGGAMAWWSVILLLPFLLFTWVMWQIVRHASVSFTREPYASEIAPNLWVSRRLYLREVPEGVVCVVDMTCEFPAARGLVKSVAHYHCLPTLDHGSPPPEQAAALLEKLRQVQGGILIHCAQGHGRSALLAAAFLVVSGSAETSDEATQAIIRRRPNVRLNHGQRATLAAIINHSKATSAA